MSDGFEANDFQPTEGQGELLREVGSLDEFFAGAVEAVEYAAEAINQDVATRGFPSIQSASLLKNDGSPVSSADQASHDELTKRLKALAPFPIVSEEEPTGVPTLESVCQYPFFWLADPLDGTRDFLAGEKTFAVSLALMRVRHMKTKDGEPRAVLTPYFGCISDPSEHRTWWGSRETPLTKRVEGEDVDLPLAATSPSLRILGSRSIPSDRMQQLYDFWKVTEITRLGSALKFALIAEGSYDVYPRFGPTSEWDTAAGQLLLEISGGGLYSLETGARMHYGKSDWRNHGFIAFGSETLKEQWLPAIRAKIKKP